MNSFRIRNWADQVQLGARRKLLLIFSFVCACLCGNLESAVVQSFPEKLLPRDILLKTTPVPLSKCRTIHLRQQQGNIITSGFSENDSATSASNCEWIIGGVPGDWIFLYFAELYLQHPAEIRVDCFDMKDGKRLNWTSLGTYNMHRIPSGAMLNTTQSFLMVTLVQQKFPSVDAQTDVTSLGLHGMNLTYQILPSSRTLPQITTEFSCDSHAGCSFLGRCIFDSSVNYSWCQCFQGYSGNKCQFGPLCDPSTNPSKNPCQNHGTCFYTKLNNITCQCPHFIIGDRCDTWTKNAIPDCERLNCEMGCSITLGQAYCNCRPGQKLNSDGKCTPVIVEPPTSSTQTPLPCKINLTGSRGFIQTPNFPGPFPVPLMCEWIVRAGLNTETVIYFTEIYNKHPAKFQILTYDTYTDGVGSGEKQIPNLQSDIPSSGFDSNDYPDNITVSGAVIVIRFQVRSLWDTAVRIKPFFLDVYGFNLTYLIVPAGKVEQRSFCHPYKCSFTGSCKVSKDFQQSFCECVDGHFGEYCEYGPQCNPTPNPTANHCLNNGRCRYRIGTHPLDCACEPGFEGARCITVSRKPKIPECELLQCDQRCLRITSTTTAMQCSCDPGFRISSTNSSECVYTGRWMMNVDIEFETQLGSLSTSNLVSKIKNLSSEVQGCVFYNFSAYNFAFKCLADRSAQKSLKEKLELAKTNQLPFWNLRMRSYTFSSFPLLDIVNLSLFSSDPTVEGSELALVCLAEGSESMNFSWSKDGMPFDPASNLGMWLTEIVLDSGRKSSQINIEDVRRVHQGIYTCSVKDLDEATTNQSISVDILRPPELVIVPATPSVLNGSSFAVTCMAVQNASYTWKRDTELVSYLSDHHVIQIWPNGKGSQLFVDSITEDTEYTCVASNPAGIKEKIVRVRVLSPITPSCPPQKFMSVKWGITVVDTTDEQPCPLDTIGTAKRKCSTSVLWSTPDFSDCVSDSVLRLKTSMEATPAGFGSWNSKDLERLAKEVYKLLVSKSLFSQSRDMNILVDLLKVLFNICELMPTHEVALRTSLVDSLNKVLDQLDTLNSTLDLIHRFPMADLEKSLSASSDTASYVAAGSFPCRENNEIVQSGISNITEIVHSTRCSFLPVKRRDVPQLSDVSVDLTLHRFFDPSFSSISQSYVVTRKRKIDILGSTNYFFADTVEIKLSDIDVLSSKCSGIIANISFGLPQITCSIISSLWSERSLRCVQRDSSNWVSEPCQTIVNFSPERKDLISHVRCSCSITKNRTFFSFEVVNRTSQEVGQTSSDHAFAITHAALLMVLGIFTIVVLSLVVLLCFRSRKIVAYLLSVKQTCNLVTCPIDLWRNCGQRDTFKPSLIQKVEV